MSMLKFSFSVLDRFLHDVQRPIALPTPGDAKRASSALDDIVNNVALIDELNVQGIRDLLKLAEKGKFTDMKQKIGDAVSDYQIIESTYKKKLFPQIQKSTNTTRKDDKTDSIDENSKDSIDENVTKAANNSTPNSDKKIVAERLDTENITNRPHGQDLINNRLLHQYDPTNKSKQHGVEARIPVQNTSGVTEESIKPTKLAEQFTALYDDEWTDAFDSIARSEGQKKNIEKDIIVYLAELLQNISEYVDKRAPALVESITILLEQTMLDPLSSTKDKITNPSMIHGSKFNRHARECVKETAKLSIPALITDFKKTELRPSLQKYKEDFQVNKYIDKCLEMLWLIQVQDLPMKLKWPNEKEHPDNILESFRQFTKSGIELDYVVWPALLIHEDGPLIVKGIVQMK